MPFRQWARLKENGDVSAGSASGPFQHNGATHDEVDIEDLRELTKELQKLGVAVVGEVAAASRH
jgi:hypothetical protein